MRQRIGLFLAALIGFVMLDFGQGEMWNIHKKEKVIREEDISIDHEDGNGSKPRHGSTAAPKLTPKPCGLNEVFDKCGACTEPSCKTGVQVCSERCNTPKCTCLPGHARNEKGVCIFEEDCPKPTTIPLPPPPPRCQLNETFAFCKRNERACRVRGVPFIPGGVRREFGDIIRIGGAKSSLVKRPGGLVPSCRAGCECKPGYVRDEKHCNCVLPFNCPVIRPPTPPTCGVNQTHFLCKPDEKLCPGQGQILQKFKKVIDDLFSSAKSSCVSGCVCKYEYRLDKKSGKCVLEKDCPPASCGENEERKKCGHACEPRCDSQKLRQLLPCPAICLPNVCQCKTGYVRNKAGKCVKPAECSGPDTCDPNELWTSCGSEHRCEPSCDKPRGEGPCYLLCIPGCFCKPGYIREKQRGKCIKTSDCPSKKCGLFQVYGSYRPECELCGSNCPPNLIPFKLTTGCHCQPGFKRSRPGLTCLPEKFCPKPTTTTHKPTTPKCDPNEEFSGRCFDVCGLPNIRTLKPCSLKCTCKFGFMRSKGRCIPESQCPKLPTTPLPPTCKHQHEHPSVACSDRTCESLMYPPPMACRPEKCRCDSGYVRAKDGSCIHESKCPKTTTLPTTTKRVVTCGKNEHPSSRCHDDTCENPNRRPGPTCAITCKCEFGYVRRFGKCIPKTQCPKPPTPKPVITTTKAPKRCGSNEHLSNACFDNTCENKDKHVPPCQIEQCRCNKGFVRGKGWFGKCIPDIFCPAHKPTTTTHKPLPTTQRCPSNEEYSKNCCEKRCGLLKPICPFAKLRSMCPLKCYCKAGYVRKELGGPCVKVDQCPRVATTLAPKTTPKCPVDEEYNENCCEKRCDLLKPICPFAKIRKMCPVKCYCKAGYVRKALGGPCVKLEQCSRPTPPPTLPPIICQANEQPGAHVKGPCVETDCRGVKNRFNQCSSFSCYCKPGYVRHEGKCILSAQCPRKQDVGKEKLVCRKDEERAKDNCEFICEDVGLPTKKKCATGGEVPLKCVCKPGFARYQKACLPAKDCMIAKKR